MLVLQTGFFVVFFCWLGGGRGIRTPVPVKANGFQDRPGMTTSVSLRALLLQYSTFR